MDAAPTRRSIDAAPTRRSMDAAPTRRSREKQRQLSKTAPPASAAAEINVILKRTTQPTNKSTASTPQKAPVVRASSHTGSSPPSQHTTRELPAENRSSAPTAIAGNAFSEQSISVDISATSDSRLSDPTTSTSLRLFTDPSKPFPQATTRGSSGSQQQPNLQPGAVPVARRTVHAPHACEPPAQQRTYRCSTTGAAEPAFETALRSAAEASAVARRLGVASQRVSATGKASRRTASKSPEQRRTSNGNAATHASRTSSFGSGAGAKSSKGIVRSCLSLACKYKILFL